VRVFERSEGGWFRVETDRFVDRFRITPHGVEEFTRTQKP